MERKQETRFERERIYECENCGVYIAIPDEQPAPFECPYCNY